VLSSYKQKRYKGKILFRIKGYQIILQVKINKKEKRKEILTLNWGTVAG
jgi:hypothetical protein